MTATISTTLHATPDQVLSKTIDRKDFLIGTVIAIFMIAFFSVVGGTPFMVTFVPGVAASWLILEWMYFKQRPLPEAGSFLPMFLIMLAWQFLHFAEEFVTGFYTSYGTFYAAPAFPANTFVIFNMASYFVFVACCLLVFTRDYKFLLMPVMFFVVYGASGNAIAHTWWVILTKAYFPGFFTALAYWFIGPWVLTRLMGSRREALIAVVLFAVALIPILTVFAQPS